MSCDNIIKPGAGSEVMYFVIGAQKAGTTWLFDYLRGHPDVASGPLKEYHYFSFIHRRMKTGAGQRFGSQLRRRWALATILHRSTPGLGLVRAFLNANSSAERYVKIVQGAQGNARVFGDITPVYSMLDRTAFAEMAACHADVRFVFIMRDPVMRLWSQIRMRARAKRIDMDAANGPFAKMISALSADPDYIGRSDYRRTIIELESAVGAHKIHYMFYENLFTKSAISGLTSFLGIAPLEADFGKVVHGGNEAVMPDVWRAEMREKLAKVYSFIGEKFANEVPASWDMNGQSGDVQSGSDLAGSAGPAPLKSTRKAAITKLKTALFRGNAEPELTEA